MFSNLNQNEKNWLVYDWANSVFATSIAAGFFPIMLKSYWANNMSQESSTLLLGATNSFISFLLFFILPALGHCLDSKILKPQNLLFFTGALGALCCLCLGFVGEGNYVTCLILYTLAFLFFAMGNTQYDALLTKISSTKKQSHLDRISSLGFMSGYLGGGLCLLLQSLALVFHKALGFSSSLWPAKLVFLSSGIWWLVFSFPLLKLNLNFKLKKLKPPFSNFLFFMKGLNKKTYLFLVSFFLYIDVVYTTYKMAVDFGMSIGLKQNQLILILIYVQVIAVPGTAFLNWISKKTSTTKALYVGIFCYALAIGLSPLTKNLNMFLLLATLIGLGQGGLQALSRSYFSSLILESQQGTGFGFLNVFGKLSAILGPLIVGFTAYVFQSNAVSMLGLLPLLALGAFALHLSAKAKGS